MKSAIQAVVEKKDLTKQEAAAVMEKLLTGAATQAQIAAFLTALRMKGETMDEIVGLASVLSDKAEHIHPNVPNYIDLVGTGGDCTFTFNISTTSALVTAAAGLPVAKHGNRSISSKSGSGDVLEALGVNIMAEPETVGKCVEEVGIGFMFAQTFHKSMKYVGQARSEMGIRTVFNILGPISNPSDAKGMVIGVYDPKLTEVLARALAGLGVERAFVFSGKDNMDEITLSTETIVSELKNGEVRTFELSPEQFGMQRVPLSELQGGNAGENAAITRAILAGERGPKRDIVLLNAGAALYIGGVSDSVAAGIKRAEEAIDSGKSMEVLEKLIAYTNR